MVSMVGLEVLSYLPDQTLEGELADEELGGLLVPPDLPEGDCSGPVSVGLLDTSGGGGGLPSGLGGQLLSGSLSSGRLTGGLLSTSHGSTEIRILLIAGQIIKSNCIAQRSFSEFFLINRNDLSLFTRQLRVIRIKAD